LRACKISSVHEIFSWSNPWLTHGAPPIPKNPPWWDTTDLNWRATLKQLPPWREKFGEEERTLHVYDGPQLRWYIPPGNVVFEHGTARPVAHVDERGVVYAGGAMLCWIQDNCMNHVSGRQFHIAV
jgi:hypothetical protein